MNRLEKLEQKLYHSGVKVRLKNPGTKDGAYVKGSNGKSFIYLSPRISPQRRLTVLAHEAGHHFSTLYDTPGRNEYSANKWATLQLLDISELIEAVKKGCRSYHELAEYLGLEDTFIKKAIEVYAKIYGHEINYNNYLVHFLPIWVKDMSTGHFWPEY